jgi:tRNA(Ile)-lysidine synthetase-like protein
MVYGGNVTKGKKKLKSIFTELKIIPSKKNQECMVCFSN